MNFPHQNVGCIPYRPSPDDNKYFMYLTTI